MAQERRDAAAFDVVSDEGQRIFSAMLRRIEAGVSWDLQHTPKQKWNDEVQRVLDEAVEQGEVDRAAAAELQVLIEAEYASRRKPHSEVYEGPPDLYSGPTDLALPKPVETPPGQ